MKRDANIKIIVDNFPKIKTELEEKLKRKY